MRREVVLDDFVVKLRLLRGEFEEPFFGVGYFGQVFDLFGVIRVFCEVKAVSADGDGRDDIA